MSHWVPESSFPLAAVEADCDCDSLSFFTNDLWYPMAYSGRLLLWWLLSSPGKSRVSNYLISDLD